MKCPKCGYLGYERTERCRNCGYEFSLRTAAATPDLRLRGDEVPAPLDDLELLDHAAPPPAARRFADAVPEVETTARAGGAHNAVVELPLFGGPITDDVPLITKPSPPRPPLAVRRATPEVPRLRFDVRTPLLELPADSAPGEPSAAVEDAPQAVAPMRGAARRAEATGPMRQAAAVTPEAAPSVLVPAALTSRAAAAAIDLVLLAAVDAAVIYLTLEICGVSLSELAIVPKIPLIAFLLVQNGGYLVAFTVVGQTLGKLLTGLRVLADDGDQSPGVTRAALRAFMWMLLALPAGLGFVPMALSRDGRGLHDRFAGTRVVRADA